MLKGSCLCGEVQFHLLKKPTGFYRCHCTLCSKQSGVGHNLATLVALEEFLWISTGDGIKSWVKASGYRNDFCRTCGSSVPNQLRDKPYVWVPLGLLDTQIDINCQVDLYTADAQCWDSIRCKDIKEQGVNSLNELLAKLGLV